MTRPRMYRLLGMALQNLDVESRHNRRLKEMSSKKEVNDC
jgi:hypothetical protein